MFNVGECVVYNREVCKIVEIKKKNLNDIDYYILRLVFDDSLKIEVPVDNRFGNIRPLISKEDIKSLINKVSTIETIVCDDRLIENEYKILINSKDHLDLFKIIKTTYLRNKERTDNNRKTTDKDNFYFCLAEKYLYQEFSIVLDMSYEDTKKYIIDEISKLDSKWEQVVMCLIMKSMN